MDGSPDVGFGQRGESRGPRSDYKPHATRHAAPTCLLGRQQHRGEHCACEHRRTEWLLPFEVLVFRERPEWVGGLSSVVRQGMKKTVVVVVAGLLSLAGGLAMAMPMADGGTFVYCSGSGATGTYRIVTCSNGGDGGCTEKNTGIRCSN